MSALLVLAGLFPPNPQEEWDPELKWQPIPYQFKSSENDHVSSSSCKKYFKELRIFILPLRYTFT